ncbi:MAG: hypothetical protein M0036_12670 [Desulfobacteraceae bacterium]|nr:hypothetical protein [Desulfobacteraceae bacterium]
MKRVGLVVACLVVIGLVASATLACADEVNITGKWFFTVQTPKGSGNPVVSFEQKGENLTGHYAGSIGEADLTGTLKNGEITFQFVTDPKAGPAIYTGKVDPTDPKKMSGDVDFAGKAKGTWEGKKVK